MEWEKQAIVGFHLKWNGKPSKKGSGFAQPLVAHQHWHIDVSYLNISGAFYYLCSILDGYSRHIVNWDIRESMTEADIKIIVQGAKEKYPEARPRVISDNGPAVNVSAGSGSGTVGSIPSGGRRDRNPRSSADNVRAESANALFET